MNPKGRFLRCVLAQGPVLF